MSGTIAFDDPDGIRFAKVREGLSKVLGSDGASPLHGSWCRECKAHTDIVHCHLLFHLPVEYRTGAKLDEIKATLDRLVDRHGDGILGEFAVRLTIWPDPDGLYLIKGGGPKVWKRFPRIRKEWRKPQGIIHGKRCGTTAQPRTSCTPARDGSKEGSVMLTARLHPIKLKKGGEVYSVILIVANCSLSVPEIQNAMRREPSFKKASRASSPCLMARLGCPAM